MGARASALILVLLLTGSATVWTQQASEPPAPARRLVWVDRSGNEKPLAGPPMAYENPRISPDGRQLAFSNETRPEHVFVCALPECATPTQYTKQGTSNNIVLWSPDAKHITFRSDALGATNVVWQMADGSGSIEKLFNGTMPNQQPRSFTPDGQLLALFIGGEVTGGDIWFLRMKDHEAFPFLNTPAHEGAPRFSPDGRAISYISSESGRLEVYVQQLAGIRGKWQVSMGGGGVEPVWSPNGRELFYRSGANFSKMMSVEITPEPNFTVGKPKMLFDKPYHATTPPGTNQMYDAAADGRLLMIKAAATNERQEH